MHEFIEPEEMRRRIRHAGEKGCRLDGKQTDGIIAPSLARQALILKKIKGLSELDAMTVLAYYTMQSCENLSDQLLEHAKLMHSTPIVTAETANG